MEFREHGFGYTHGFDVLKAVVNFGTGTYHSDIRMFSVQSIEKALLVMVVAVGEDAVVGRDEARVVLGKGFVVRADNACGKWEALGSK